MSDTFMGDFYDHYYEDPYMAAYNMSEEYPAIQKEYMEKNETLIEELGGIGSDLCDKYEEVTGLLIQKGIILARESYILGTQDMSRIIKDILEA